MKNKKEKNNIYKELIKKQKYGKEKQF